MASTTNGALPPNFFLTPQQQNLLFAALNSNRQQQQQQQQQQQAAQASNNMLSLSPTSLTTSPGQKDSLQDSPFLDNYDYDLDPDSSFDFDFTNSGQAKMIGDIPGTAQSESTENETHDKRSHPDDDDDDEGSPDSSSGGNTNKRRESTEKVAKKPGRKPLTTEPSSKRKAQNRAAQRAFRERKEKHLKDLETKVEDLEKASEAANHENSLLRAQVDRMTTEIDEYKKKITVMSNARSLSGPKTTGTFGNAVISNLTDVNFQFEFPKFGMLPGPPASKPSRSSTSASLSPPSFGDFNATSPSTQSNGRSPISLNADSPADASQKDDLAKLSGVFSPPLTNHAVSIASRGNSLDSLNFNFGPVSTSSPSASSNSNRGPSSSCGTSPEPFTQSPMGFKPIDTMTTIGEEQPSVTGDSQGFSQFAGLDFNTASIDWLAQQNGGQFDPQLFGGYREPQENILANATFDDSFFNDALDADFFTPYNMAPSPAVSKKNLIAEIDAEKEADTEPVQAPKGLSHTMIWEKLQNCPKVQTGEFDLDGLCSELTKKAKCSGKGPVVAEHDFEAAVKKFMGKEATCAGVTASSTTVSTST